MANDYTEVVHQNEEKMEINMDKYEVRMNVNDLSIFLFLFNELRISSEPVRETGLSGSTSGRQRPVGHPRNPAGPGLTYSRQFSGTGTAR
ncbi:MAG: hypothetical protein AB7I04_12245 [Pseudomonadales bacterium]